MRYLLFVSSWLAACSLNVDYTGTFYQCGEGGTCPDGYTCLQNVCIPDAPPPPACSTGIAAGGRHTCSIRDDGTLWCWGRNGYGQLGDGTKTSSATPVQVQGLESVIAVATGAEHTCALVEGGTAYCWGANTMGQLGDGTDGDSSTPSMLALPNVTAIGAGAEFSCAISSGTVSCWGRNSEGQIGDGTQTQRNSPTSTGVAAAKLTVYGDTACAISASNEARCWGENGAGQLGLGTNMSVRTPTVIGADIAEVAVGEDHLCIRRTNDALECAGTDDHGRLGWGDRGDSNVFVPVGISVRLTSIVAGDAHTCGIDDDKRVWCWGFGADGRLANGTSDDSPFPARTQLEDAEQLVAGRDHTCARTSRGEVFCAGFNGFAQLGNGFATTHAAPFAIPGLTGVRSLALGYGFSCAVGADKNVTCWGDGEAGEIANGFLSSSTPLTVGGIGTVEKLRAGGGHACALDGAGAVFCWGYNNYGQVGNGSRANVATPTRVALPGPATDIATGNEHSCAIVGGDVWCWGLGEQGQLGQGPGYTYGDHESLPVQVMMISGATALAAGEQHVCALVGTGVQCWGANYYGGLGTMGMSSGLPVAAEISNVTALAARGAVTYAVSNGALWGWGSNCNLKLTRGNCGANPIPVELPALAGLTNVRPGFETGCGLRNGNVVCWGAGNLGQTGDDSYEYNVPPTQVAGLDGMIDVEAGGAHTCAVHADGRVSCWGYNNVGQIGDGHTATEDPVGVRLACE